MKTKPIPTALWPFLDSISKHGVRVVTPTMLKPYEHPKDKPTESEVRK